MVCLSVLSMLEVHLLPNKPPTVSTVYSWVAAGALCGVRQTVSLGLGDHAEVKPCLSSQKQQQELRRNEVPTISSLRASTLMLSVSCTLSYGSSMLTAGPFQAAVYCKGKSSSFVHIDMHGSQLMHSGFGFSMPKKPP